MNDPHKMQLIGDGVATSMHIEGNRAAVSQVRERGVLAKRENSSEASDKSDTDSLSTDSTQSLIKSDMQQRDAPMVRV